MKPDSVTPEMEEIAREFADKILYWHGDAPCTSKCLPSLKDLLLAALSKYGGKIQPRFGIKPGANTQFLGRGKGYLHDRSDELGGEGHPGFDGKPEPDSAEDAQKQKALTLEYVTSQIVSCGHRFQTDCGITPFDVCLGPAEFAIIYEDAQRHLLVGSTPKWHHEARHLWYSGMRLRLMNTPGVLVGVLESRGERGNAPSVPCASPQGAAPVTKESSRPSR